MRLVGIAIAASLLVGACKQKPQPVPDATPDPVAIVDAAPEVDPMLAMIADAVAGLEALEDSGLDADPASLVAVHIEYGTAKVTPKGALEPSAELARGRFRFRGCVLSSDAGPSPVGIVLTIKVGEGGEVASVTTKDKGPIADCFVAAARRFRFAEPTSGSATIEVPIAAARR